jgi:hypothetical protein
LIILDPDDAPHTPDDYDSMVSAQLPDPVTEPELHALVSAHMMHGPCGPDKPCRATASDSERCSKGFPKAFQEHTVRSDDGFPLYARPDNGRTVLRNGTRLDNRHVVPYNPWLLRRYQCHMNVEVRACVCVHVCVRAWVCACACACEHACVSACEYVCACVCVFACTPMCMHQRWHIDAAQLPA